MVYELEERRENFNADLKRELEKRAEQEERKIRLLEKIFGLPPDDRRLDSRKRCPPSRGGRSPSRERRSPSRVRRTPLSESLTHQQFDVSSSSHLTGRISLSDDISSGGTSFDCGRVGSQSSFGRFTPREPPSSFEQMSSIRGWVNNSNGWDTPGPSTALQRTFTPPSRESLRRDWDDISSGSSEEEQPNTRQAMKLPDWMFNSYSQPPLIRPSNQVLPDWVFGSYIQQCGTQQQTEK